MYAELFDVFPIHKFIFSHKYLILEDINNAQMHE